MPVAAIASAPYSKPSGLRGLAHDLDALFRPPPALAPIARRAQDVVDAIDWTQPLVVIWVPGTSGHELSPELTRLLAARGITNATFMPYQATWRFRDSVPDGEATLHAVLELVKTRRRPGQRVVLLGESQGAWIISSVLRDPALAALVDRVALVAHPALAPAHTHALSTPTTHLDARVHEFNDEHDVVTRDLGRSAPAALDVIDSFARLEVGHALLGALGIAVRNPAVIQALIASQLFRVNGTDNPHHAGTLMEQALAWALDAPA
jgi:hypothetical protein